MGDEGRDLQRETALALGWTTEDDGRGREEWNLPDGRAAQDPAFLSSLDAAHAIAPRGCHLAFDPHFMDDEGVVRFKGYCLRPDWSRWTPHGDWVEHLAVSRLATSPARAMAAAALLGGAALLGEADATERGE